MTLRSAAGITFLLVQLGFIIHARFVPARWLCWAPNDYAVQYQLQVKTRGHDLSPAEIQARYHVPEHGWYENPAENIMDIVRQYECTYGKGDGAEVRLSYQLDGGERREWLWRD